MAKVFFALLSVTCLHATAGDINVTDYIYWKKADINAWHQYFPSRALQEEQGTISAAAAAVLSMSSSLNASLSSVVAFQAQELLTAQLLMDGTDAQGCIQGISNYMPTAVSDEMTTYEDCAADALAKIQRLNVTWAKNRGNYMASYQRALNGIDVCAKTYPNKDSINRLMSCVESMNNNYFAASNATVKAMTPSASMSYFQQNVLQCASTAAQNVAAKGWKFLGMLVQCSKLSGKVDPDEYAKELNKWQGYNDTLQSQINISQAKNHDQMKNVELEMINYYNLQKRVLQQYVIESRGNKFYVSKMYDKLSDYYNTVTATALDNPGETECADTAKAALDALANDSASTSLDCDISIVNNTKELVAKVNNDFLALKDLMPPSGNAALLSCLSQGYEFAPNTVAECFNLVYSGFDVEHSDRRDAIEQAVTVLEGYFQTFYSGNDLPCGGSSLRRLLLGGDTVLYNLQRCLYVGSGTDYDVTTPSQNTSTTTEWWYTTTSPAYTNV